jgi:hypothetical protein
MTVSPLLIFEGAPNFSRDSITPATGLRGRMELVEGK